MSPYHHHVRRDAPGPLPSPQRLAAGLRRREDGDPERDAEQHAGCAHLTLQRWLPLVAGGDEKAPRHTVIGPLSHFELGSGCDAEDVSGEVHLTKRSMHALGEQSR